MSHRCSELIIAGFHRSGTSAAARLLHAGGLFVGSDLLGANVSNPYGHYEDREVVRLHDQILADNGLNWQVTDDLLPAIWQSRWNAMERLVERRRVTHRLWGFKDPRACFFLAAWKHLMPSARVLIVFRHVADSSYSLQRRHAFEMLEGRGDRAKHIRFFEVPDLAARMWLAHNRALLAFARAHPEDVLAVSFESLLRGLPLTRLLRSAWDAPLGEVATLSALDPLVRTKRDNRLPLSDPALGEELDDALRRLSALAARTEQLVVG